MAFAILEQEKLSFLLKGIDIEKKYMCIAISIISCIIDNRSSRMKKVFLADSLLSGVCVLVS